MTTVLDCELKLHDFTFFATREIGRLYETERAIHNYALCYALGLVQSPYFTGEQIPTYRRDLEEINRRGIYVTPAHAKSVRFSLATWKYASNHYHVEMGKMQTNTPSFGRAKELAPESDFRFFIVCRDDVFRPPRWIRLGKWLSKAEVTIKEEHEAAEKKGEFQGDGLLNPLDVPSDCALKRCNVLNMPPVSLLEHAVLDGRHLFVKDGPKLPADMQFRFPRNPPATAGGTDRR